MARYNVYKIKDGQVSELQNHLTKDRKYKLADSFSSHGYQVYTYFAGPDSTDMWWLEQYGQHFPEHTDKHNQIYSGAVVANNTSKKSGYIIPLGKTHFYIQNFIEINFGLELAERIADEKQTKMKSLKNFGGKTSKSLTSYISGSNLLFSSGESAEYLKLKAQNKETWGDSFVHFGSSVQFNSLEIEPDDLGILLSNIDSAIKGKKILHLPLMKEIKEPALLVQLYSNLAEKILSADNSIGILDYEIYGVDFIFSQQTHIKLKCEGIYSDQLPQLTLENIITFVNNNEIDLKDCLQKIKIQFLVDGESKYTVPLLQLIEYYGDDKSFLYKGKWFYFNESFIESLHNALAKVGVSEFGTAFSESEFKAWQKTNKSKVNYRERFVIEKIHEESKFEILDRDLDYLGIGDKKYQLEIGDLYDSKSKSLYVVKIGSPSDFGYAFDQTFTLLSNVKGQKYISSDNKAYLIETVNVLIIFRTNRKLKDAIDTKSLIFEIKLNELQKIAFEKNIKLNLTFTTIL